MPFTRIASHDETLLRRMCAEWLEMPGMRLTAAQAARLWALERSTCDSALAALVESRFLVRTRDGAYLRRGEAGMRPFGAGDDGLLPRGGIVSDAGGQ